MSAQSNYDAAAVDSLAIVLPASADNLTQRLTAKVANDTLIATQQAGSVEPKVDALTSNAWSPEAVAAIGARR